MKSILLKLKKIMTPLAIANLCAGLLTILCYLIFFKNNAGKGESTAFLLILYFCFAALGTLTVYILSDHYRGGSFLEKAVDPTYALLTGIEQPVLICSDEGKILWINKAFYKQCGNKDVAGKNTAQYFSAQPDLLCDGARFPDGVKATLGGREYIVKGYRVKVNDRKSCITVWQDRTDYVALQKKYDEDAPLICYVVIDNLDEILRFSEGNYRTVASRIDEVMQAWASENGGIIREYDRDKYQMIMRAAALESLTEEKFEILDRIREVRVGENNIPVTVSIGIGNVSGSLEEKAAASISALETALQRGGDQAIVKTAAGLEAYGGKTKTIQKKTKVKARVIATQLTELICSSDNVLIMAHRFADFDAFGSCIGIAHLCSMCGVAYNIVIDPRNQMLKKNYEKAKKIPTVGKDTFIEAAEAQDRLRSNTLLIICDVSNPSQFESPELAASAANIVCIDHHRKTGEFEVQPIISYIDPSASSACELVADMLEQSIPAGTLTKDEAELMMAGIVLDTKKYEINTGTKTFGAAQYLKGEGADTGEVQQLFITDFDDYRREAGFGAKVTVYRDKYAISINEQTDDDPSNRTAAAKAADRLLSVEGVEASFAVCKIGDAVRVSGRSNGRINVQLILERIGGGGRFDAAAAELKTAVLTETLTRLKGSIDFYEDELKQAAEKEKEKDKESKESKENKEAAQ